VVSASAFVGSGERGDGMAINFGRATREALLAAAVLLAIVGEADAASCMDQAAGKKLAGAALKSFLTKCQKDAQASCDAAAHDKKLTGAARTSFTKKCVIDATGSH
jgi:hypothetical protein